MYYKITLGENIIDVFTEPEYVKYSSRAKTVLRQPKAQDAEGIISQRTGRYYHVEGWPEFPEAVTNSGGTVILEEIDETSYRALVQMLDSEGPVPGDTAEEIISSDSNLETVIRRKVEAMNSACNAAIVAGFDLTLSDGETYHFTMKDEDQTAILLVFMQAQAGANEIDFYAADRKCLTMTTEDAVLLGTTATVFRSYHVAYYRCLAEWVESMTSITEAAAVSYGDIIPEKFRSIYLMKYATALGVIPYAAVQ